MATKRAVLVGCNYPYTKFRLHGCANDVKSIKDIIKKKFGFDERNITVLTDDKDSEGWSSSCLPTGANIKAALNAMVKKAKPEDVLFFYFSGHGTTIPVLEPHKPFRQDEAIVPCDFNLITGVWLTGYQQKQASQFFRIHAIVVVSLKKRKKQTVSSEDTENTDNQVKGKVKVKAKPKFLGFDFISHAIDTAAGWAVQAVDTAAGWAGQAIDTAAGFAHNEVTKIAQGTHRIFGKDVSLKFHPHYTGGALQLDALEEDDGILLSGCESDETSYDIVSGGRAYGAFTDAVVKTLTNLSAHEEITNKKLLSMAAEAVRKQAHEAEQHPCLYCSDNNKDQPFLGGFA